MEGTDRTTVTGGVNAPPQKVRVAMVGAGHQANLVHYPSLASFSDVELAGICDINTARLNATADKYGICRRYTDYQKMVEEIAPDAIYVIGPPHVMFPIWLWCLNQGLSLFIEKPMGLTLHHARVLAHLAEKKGCLTQVGFQRRSCPLAVKVREECLKRGPIVHAVSTFYKPAAASGFDTVEHMMDDGVHAIDTLRWMCGGEVVKIDSQCQRVFGVDVDCIIALFRFDTGATGVVLTNWTSGRRVFRVEMHAPGICGEVEHEGKGRVYVDGDYQGVEYDTREVAGSDEWYVYAGYRAKNREFIDCVRSGRQPDSSFEDALKTMEIAAKVLGQEALTS